MLPLCLFKCHDFKKYSSSFPYLLKLEKSLSEDHYIKNSDDTIVTKDPWGLLLKYAFSYAKHFVLFSVLRNSLFSQETSDIYRLTDFEFTEHLRIFSL